MDSKLKNITAPTLSSTSYGTDISTVFDNIDENFKTVGNYDFIKGQQGNSIHIEYVNIKKTVSGSPDSIEILGNDLYKALTKSIEKFICDYNNISSAGSGSGVVVAEVIANSLRSIGTYEWDSWVDDVRVPLIVSENTINKTKEYICSAAVVLFSDARFSSTSLGKNYSKFGSDMIDTTCYINFIRNKYTNEWECQINTNYPRLKFKNNAFYWEVNGSETAIRSTGVQGENGKDGNTFICKYHSSNPSGDFVDKALLPISDILSGDGSGWTDINTVDIFDGAPVIVHLTSLSPGESTPTYHGYITSHIQITETATGKTGTVIYLSDTDNKLTWVEGASHDVFNTLGTKGLEIDPTTPPLDAMPGMFVRMYTGATATDPSSKYAHCIYSINEIDSSELDDKKTLMISPKESYLNTLGNNITGCNLKIEYPTTITTNKESGGIVLMDDSISLQSKIEINNNSGTGVDISAKNKPIKIWTHAGTNINIESANDTNIHSSSNTTIKSDSDTIINSDVSTTITSTDYTKITDKKNTITCGKDGTKSGVTIEAADPIKISKTADNVTDSIVIDEHKIYMNAQNKSKNSNYITVNSDVTCTSGGIYLYTDNGNIEMSSAASMFLGARTSSVTINSATGVNLRYNSTDKLLVKDTNVTLNKIPLVTPALQFPFGWFSNISTTSNKPDIGIPTGSENTIEIKWSDLVNDKYTKVQGGTKYQCVTCGHMTIYLRIAAQGSNGDVYIRIIDYPTCSLFPIGVLVENTTTEYFGKNIYLQFTNKTSSWTPPSDAWLKSKILINSSIGKQNSKQDIHFILTKHAGSAAKIQALENT